MVCEYACELPCYLQAIIQNHVFCVPKSIESAGTILSDPEGKESLGIILLRPKEYCDAFEKCGIYCHMQMRKERENGK